MVLHNNLLIKLCIVIINLLELDICDTSKYEMRLFSDVITFTLILFQRRVFLSEHFLKLIDDTKVVDALTNKICSIVYRRKSIKSIGNRQLDIELLEKVKEKLKNIQESKEKLAKRQSTHTLGT